MAARGKAWTTAEDDIIRLLLAQNKSYRQIAAILGRGKSSVGLRIKRMGESDQIGQGVLDMGQANVAK